MRLNLIKCILLLLAGTSLIFITIYFQEDSTNLANSGVNSTSKDINSLNTLVIELDSAAHSLVENHTSIANISSENRAILRVNSDNESDGVDDIIDLDDDNDGILDTVECPTFTIEDDYSNWSNEGGWEPNGSTTIVANFDNNITDQETCYTVPDVSSIANATAFTLRLNLRTNGASNVIVNNHFSDLDFLINGTNYATFSNPNDGVSSDVTVTTNNGAVASLSSFPISTTTGPFTEVDLTIPWSSAATSMEICYNITSDRDDWSVSTTTFLHANNFACDTDGDGLPNHVDLDSDNDGCYDSFEASVIGATITGSVTDSLTPGPYGANGFADALETGTTGVYDGTYTYANAITETVGPCISDWGDLPDVSASTNSADYQTTRANNGPFHILVSDLSLGSTVDDESDGQPNSDATGDGNDEDGLTIMQSLNIAPGGTIRLPFSYTNPTGIPAEIEAWIDWNNNGTFDGGEMIYDETDPSNDFIQITIPNDVVTDAFLGLRIRISNNDNMTPYGLVYGGEVEDYLIEAVCDEQTCLPISATVKQN